MSKKATPLYVVCSTRPRVGKTLVSRILTEFYLIDSRPVAAFDLADEGPQLVNYLPKMTTVVDIGDVRGQVAFFDQLIAADPRAKIIDLSHRAFDDFFSIVREIRFFEEALSGASRLGIFHPEDLDNSHLGRLCQKRFFLR